MKERCRCELNRSIWETSGVLAGCLHSSLLSFWRPRQFRRNICDCQFYRHERTAEEIMWSYDHHGRSKKGDTQSSEQTSSIDEIGRKWDRNIILVPLHNFSGYFSCKTRCTCYDLDRQKQQMHAVKLMLRVLVQKPIRFVCALSVN